MRLTDTTFRDGQQSLLATRLTTEDLLSLCREMDQVGFYSMEVWGGATFDTCLRYLNEDPWERLRLIKKNLSNTKTSMLVRGQSLVGYKHFPDDIVEKFIEKAHANGIDIFRIFDVLDDLRNYETPVRAAKRVGARVQGQILYTKSPHHSTDNYVRQAQALEKMGVDDIVFEDMAGLMTPYDVEELYSKLKKVIQVPLHLHCHSTSGMAPMCYMKAVELGVTTIDTAMSPLAMGTSQPATETMVAAFAGTQYDSGLDIKRLNRIAKRLSKLLENYDPIPNRFLKVDVDVLEYQIPGGMLSNLYAQLNQYGQAAKFQAVLEEVPRVRAELGYPPLATPASQFVGAQASINVLTGQRYKMIPLEVKNYVRGLYGRPPAAIDEFVREKAVGNMEIVECRPADLLEPQWDSIVASVDKSLIQQEEDYLSYALFPEVAMAFFKKRNQSA